MSGMYAHFNTSAQPVTELRSDCPPNLAAAVMRMLEKEPEVRWPTMDDVVAVCGRPSLRRDDPIRSEMISLAKTGNPARLLPELTPTRPLALARSRRPPGAALARRARAGWWAGGLGALALAALVWWIAPWRLGRVPPPPQQPLAALPPPNAVAETTTAQRPPVTDVKVGGGAGARGRPPAAPRGEPAARRTTGEDSVLGSLRATALAAMRRAAAAGATAAELAPGDTQLRSAASLAGAGRLSDAMMRLVTVTSLFNETERVARARAARDTAPPTAPPAALPAAPSVAVDPRPAIESAIAAYARALETRDIGEVRRAYPGLTSAQQQGWEDLFRASRSLKARLTVSALDVRGGGGGGGGGAPAAGVDGVEKPPP